MERLNPPKKPKVKSPRNTFSVKGSRKSLKKYNLNKKRKLLAIKKRQEKLLIKTSRASLQNKNKKNSWFANFKYTIYNMDLQNSPYKAAKKYTNNEKQEGVILRNLQDKGHFPDVQSPRLGFEQEYNFKNDKNEDDQEAYLREQLYKLLQVKQKKIDTIISKMVVDDTQHKNTEKIKKQIIAQVLQ